MKGIFRVCAPLALLPYLGALAAWLGLTFAAFAAALSGWLDRRIGWRTILAFPAVLMTAGHGQNAFLSAALLSTGAIWLAARPILAGVAFGLLAFKPHLGLMIPVALAAAGRWKTIASATVTDLARRPPSFHHAFICFAAHSGERSSWQVVHALGIPNCAVVSGTGAWNV